MESLPIIGDPSQVAQASEAAKGSYAFVSLGCPKNLIDSERMLGLLQLDGYQLVEQPQGADFVVVNTCGFIEQAREESFSAIDEMLELKRQGKTRGVIVSGCLAEKQKEQLLEDRPEIDSLVGVFGREEVTRIADRLVGDLDEQRSVFRPAPIRALSDSGRLRVTPPHFAYLKISEGCDRLCTFCAIPQMRGKHASKPIEQIVEEAQNLVQDGAQELILVAQDTTYYGIDIYGQPRLSELLEKLAEVEGLRWIRLMYLYPMYIDDRLIETIASTPKILPYLDLPLQHINDEMLKRMARRVTRQETEDLLTRLREGIPDLVLRTTFITGFPGETEAHFQEMAEFVEQQRFQRLGVFTYSYEDSTPSARLPDQVPEDVKTDRQERLMAIQQTLAFEWSQQQIGQRREVILDRFLEEQRTGKGKKKKVQRVWVGRSYADAPDVDALVYVTSQSRDLQTGQIVECEIVGAQGYDLAGWH